MKVLKGLLFLLLAVLVFCGFITAFSTVPKRFEESAREKTLARLRESGTVVDESYVNTTIENAVHDNLHTIYRTTILVSLAAALAVCMLAFRPPHDCGGLNLFNPLAIPLIALTLISLCAAISLALNAVEGQSVAEFRQAITQLTQYTSADSGGDRLLVYFLIPLALEAIFRGYIFSFLEKLHFSAAIALSTAAYALAAYYCMYSYSMRAIGSSASAAPAMFIAMAIGFVLSVITWRLRSCIPALCGHVFIANSAPLVSRICESGRASLPLAIIVLAGSLALLVFLPMLLAKRAPIFAYDYPFTEHHKRMYKYLDGKRAKRAQKLKKSAAGDADIDKSGADDELKVSSLVDAKTEARKGKGASSGSANAKKSGAVRSACKKSSDGKKR